MGVMTLTKPDSMVTSMPSPPNSPEVSTFIFLKLSGLMYAENGSRDCNIPLIAPSITSLWSTSLT